MDRLNFFNTISGIEYPEMLVNFYDQFICLKEIMTEYISISVVNHTSNSITFSTNYENSDSKNRILSKLQSNSLIIYGRPIGISINNLTDTEIVFTLS